MRATLRRYYGVGLDDVLNGTVSVDEAWDLLMNAPRDSPVISAIADDPEYASAPGRPKPLALAQWSPERETLAAIYDRLGSLQATMVVLAGGRAPEIPPHPKPRAVTASRRVAAAADDAEADALHKRLVSQLIRPAERRTRGELQRRNCLHLRQA